MESSKYNLTEGGILKKLLLVALPIMGTQAAVLVYNLTDMFWLGRVGSDVVAASGAAGMYMWLSFGFIMIGKMGAEIGVAQFIGRGDKKAALAFSQNSMFISLVLGLLFGMAAIFTNKPLISFFNFREEEIAEYAAEYLFIIGFPQPIIFLSSTAAGTYTASGNSRTPFIINSIGLVINLFLDPFLIIVLEMGIKGAAIATAISQSLVGITQIAALFVFKGRPFENYLVKFHLELRKIIQLLKWSVPIGLESLLFCFLTMITTRIETSFGAGAIAASRVGSQMEALTWLIGAGFGSALVAFIGQNYGAGKHMRVGRGVKISMIAISIWGSIVTLFMFTLGPVVFQFFLPAPELLPLGRAYLYILAFCQLPMNLEAVGSGAFKGIGRTFPPSLVSIITNGARPIIAWFLSRTSLGIYGVWMGISITALVRGIWVCVWYTTNSRKAAV